MAVWSRNLGDKYDPHGYGLYDLSWKYVRASFLRFMAAERIMQDRLMTAIYPGKILSGDHTFKVGVCYGLLACLYSPAATWRCVFGSLSDILISTLFHALIAAAQIAKIMLFCEGKYWTALFTLENEANLTVSYAFVSSTKLEELDPMLEQLIERYGWDNECGPLVIYVDDCEGQRRFWESRCPSLRKLRRGGSSDEAGSSSSSLAPAALKLDDDVDLIFVNQLAAVKEAMRDLRAADPSIVAMDGEWCVTKVMGKKVVDVLQLAYRHGGRMKVIVIHLYKIANMRAEVVDCVQDFFSRPGFVKVSRLGCVVCYPV